MSKNSDETKKVIVPEDGMGERIRARREEKNLTQEALSILTRYKEIDPECRGLSRPTIVGYEQGKNLPDARGIRLLAMALNVSPSWLVLGKYDSPDLADPKQTLLDALDRYTTRRFKDLQAPENNLTFLQPPVFEPFDYYDRMTLEKRASEEAKLETQKRNKTAPR